MSDDKPKPEDYFLSGEEPDGSTLEAPPPRPSQLEPLIDGIPAFVAMEDAIAAAKESVYVSFWIFNPGTPVQSRAARTKGVATWGDLLRAAAERGVQVRLLLTDFDALFSPDLHMNNWKAYGTMVVQGMRLTGAARERLQVVVSRHPATASSGIGDELEKRLAAAVTRLNKAGAKGKGGKSTVDTARLQNLPGVWQWLDYDAKTKKVAAKKKRSLAASPVAPHQKLVIVDEGLAFCGGLDVNTGRLDTPSHKSAATAWHDVQAKVTGDAAVDICRNFMKRWNDEAPIFVKFRVAANKAGMPVTIPLMTITTPLKLSGKPKAVKTPSKVQVHCTLSADSAWSVVPSVVVNDISDAYEKAIGAAREYIYIENQYIRSPDLQGWINDRAAKMKELRVIMVLPVAPEEVGMKGGADAITNHGLFLQHELITDLQKNLGSRFGAFSMVKKQAGTGHATDSFKSPQIYVHSKVVIVDDVYAMIGSANASPRSFKVDTEMNVGWFDGAGVAAFRNRLWAELLGSPSGLGAWKPKEFVDKWTAIAKANESAAAAKRSGFIVRHDPQRFPGLKSNLIPDALANVFDPPVGDGRETQPA